MKMRGVISQGLILPLSMFDLALSEAEEYHETQMDLSTGLNVIKWELEEAGQSGQQRTKANTFPRFISKTDQERIQNMMHYFEIHEDTEFEETLKLDGSSMTAYKVANDMPWYKTILNFVVYCISLGKVEEFFPHVHFGVCSRNLELTRTNEKSPSTFWKVAYRNKLEAKLPIGYAVQGELVGPGIQSNHEKVTDHELYVYDIFSIKEQRYLTPLERNRMMHTHLRGVKHVPIPASNIQIFKLAKTFGDIQDRVTGESFNPGTISEGRVYKSLDGKTTFKVVSNEYLLKGGN
jgi:RNA ligase (TIGR02306 family)